MATDNFQKLVAFLKERFPCSRKLVIRRCKMRDYGSTSMNVAGTQITVSIRKDKEAVEAETVCHEWAHVLEFDKVGNHGAMWGKLYAEIYSAWCQWDSQPESK